MELFKLFGTIALNGTDKFNQDIDEATNKGSKLASALGNGLKTAAKVGGAAIASAAAGVAALTKTSLDSYAEYEQLVGGVETLFNETQLSLEDYAASIGKTKEEAFMDWSMLTAGARMVKNNAAEAFKTAGMSANEYMSTVTSFSASLLQSLGGDTRAAAEKADQAITDMADNANKMGTSMEMIQNAYQGFAKANYTMLDNLKLGYGGTQSEMKRLLADAEKLSGVKYDISSYADVIDAIHVIQTEMGITGTTAKEASTTIEGSLSSMKAAWKNLTTGIADENAQVDVLVDDLVETIVGENGVGGVANNIMPRIQQIFAGIGAMVQKLAPIIGAAIPQLVNTILPPMIQAGISLVNSLLAGIRENLDAIATGAVEIAMMLLEALGGMIPELLMMGVEILVALIDGIASKPDTLVKTAITLISTLCKGLLKALPEIARAATDLMAGLISSIVLHLPEILMTGVELVLSLVGGMGEALSEVMKFGEKIVQNIIDGIAKAWDGLVSWFNNLWDGLFGKRDVNVNVNQNAGSNAFGGGYNGSHASGLDYVPFNGYIAELHKGEMVLTAAEARKLRNNTTEEKNIIINLTTTLDGKVIGETSYKYAQNMARAMGV